MICESDASSLEKMLLSGQIDMAITSLPLRSKYIQYKEYLRDRFVVLLRRGSPLIEKYSTAPDGGRVIRMTDLQDEPIACTFPGQRSRIITDAIFLRAHIRPNIVMETRNISTLRFFADQGNCIGVC